MEITSNTNQVATTSTSTTSAAPAESFTYTVQEGTTVRQITSTEKLWESDPDVIMQRTTATFMGALLNLALYGAALETAGVTSTTPMTTTIPATTQTPAAETSAQSTATAAETETTAADETTDDTADVAETVMVTVPTDQVLIANRLINRLDGNQDNTIDFEEAEKNIQRFAQPAEGESSVLPTGAWGGTQGATDDLSDVLRTYMTTIASFDADGDGQLEREELLAHLPFGGGTTA